MKIKLLIIIILFPFIVFSQIRGLNSYMFVNLETSPRVTAMGGNLIAVYDDDLSLARTTPSLLNASMNNHLVFSFTDYLSDINIISFSYAREFKMIGVLSMDIKSIDYGSFQWNNEFGENIGNFSATDQIITFGVGRRLNSSFSMGANLSLLHSNYELYNSLALSSNIATTYIDMNKRMVSTLILKNIGRQLTTFNNPEEFPFEMQFAISKVLAHLPFRYHISYNYINYFNIKSPYKLIQQTNFETGNLEIVEETIAKTFLRHIIIGGELNPFKRSLYLRAGFNFQRRFDLSLDTYPAMVGFSWGIGFRISRFRFDYGRVSYHLSNTPNHFSIGTKLSTFGL